MAFTLLTTVRSTATRWAKALYGEMSTLEKAALGWLLLLLIISGSFSLAGYINRHTNLIPQTGGIYREAAVGQPRFVNPILAGSNDIDVDLSSLIYSSLFAFDRDLNLVNELATGYEVSADNRQYTVKLRQDVQWHDGKPFTADDVVFTIRSIQTPDYASPLTNAFQGVEIEKVDDFTVRFTLKQAYAPFLTSLTVGIVPQHVWESIEPKNASLAEQVLKPVGTGPFKFSEIATQRKTGEVTNFNLVRNDSYFGQRPYLDEIDFVFFPTQDEAISALLAGRVDGLSFLPLQLRNRTDRRSLTMHRLLLPQYVGLFFNQQRNERLADAGIRNALALALDRPAIVKEALQDEGEPLHLPIPRGLIAFNEELPPPTYDPEAAKQNLEEGGWRDSDGDGIRDKDGQPLRLKITTTDLPEYVRTAELVKEQWKKIGVETDIESFGVGTVQQTVIRPRDYDILLFGEILTADDPFPFWHSTQSRSPGLNFSLFKNDEVDKLLESARTTLDTGERQIKYREFQGKILDLKPALILYRPYYLFVQKRTVRGAEPNFAARVSDRFNDIENWHIKVKRIWNEE